MDQAESEQGMRQRVGALAGQLHAQQAQNARPMTLGERRVRISFNPNQARHVGEIKTQAAALIDYCEALKGRAADLPAEDKGELLPSESSELHRLIALAQTHAEDAAMWAVKAATIGLP